MKKLLCLALSVMMIVSCFACVTAFADDIKITIDGKNLTMDQPPVLKDSRTLVPLRAIFEALGATVSWDDATQTAKGVKDGKEIKITINDTTAYVDGKATTLDVPAQLINSRTLVPVRFISESLGAKVEWIDATQTVVITSPATPAPAPAVSANPIADTSVAGVVKFTFDDATADTFKWGKSHIVGGTGLASDKVTLSKEKDHTTGSGQSVKLDGMTNQGRFKLKNCFEGAKIGDKFEVSAWVYSPSGKPRVQVGVMGDAGTSIAMNAVADKKMIIEEGEWTEIKFSFTYNNAEASQVIVTQFPLDGKFYPTLYVDDVVITKK